MDVQIINSVIGGSVVGGDVYLQVNIGIYAMILSAVMFSSALVFFATHQCRCNHCYCIEYCYMLCPWEMGHESK